VAGLQTVATNEEAAARNSRRLSLFPRQVGFVNAMSLWLKKSAEMILAGVGLKYKRCHLGRSQMPEAPINENDLSASGMANSQMWTLS
jgi:hypothetical protein